MGLAVLWIYILHGNCMIPMFAFSFGLSTINGNLIFFFFVPLE